MVKLFLVVLVLFITFNEFYCAPLEYIPLQLIPINILQTSGNSPNANHPKFVWNFIGDVLTNTGYLPIEINVPDTVSNIYGGAQNVAQGLTTAAGNILQRIPFVTRLTRPESPRPFRLHLVVNDQGQIVGALMPGDFKHI